MNASMDADDFYLSHNYKSSLNPKKTQQDLLIALLNTYRKILNAVASAENNEVWPPGHASDGEVVETIDRALEKRDIEEMTSLLIELGEFERDRQPKDPLVRRDYRLRQAVWASKYDKLRGRKPVISDTYIQFPKGGI